MAVALMIASAVISVVFLFDFTRTLLEIQRDQVAVRNRSRDMRGFDV